MCLYTHKCTHTRARTNTKTCMLKYVYHSFHNAAYSPWSNVTETPLNTGHEFTAFSTKLAIIIQDLIIINLCKTIININHLTGDGVEDIFPECGLASINQKLSYSVT